MKRSAPVLAVLCLALVSPAAAVSNLLTNPGFADTDLDFFYGDGWGNFDNTDFNDFFGFENPTASFFADQAGNSGGVFQQGIAAGEGQTYQLDLLDTRIESAWDADLYFGVEFYAGDDETLVGVEEVLIDTAERLANNSTDGNAFAMQATAPVGAVFARPIIRFDNVNETYQGQQQANAFVFLSYFSEVPAAGGEILKDPGFDEDLTLDGNGGDAWDSFGNAGFNDFFGGNAHASFFADTPGNSGGIFQQAVLGDEGTEYEFSLTDVRIEENFAADVTFGLEFYGTDDATKLGEVIVPVDTATTGDSLSFSMTATAVPGTVYVRPIVLFDNVTSTATEQENLFIFDSSLVEVIGGDVLGDFNGDGRVDNGDLNLLLGSWGDATVPPEWVNGFTGPVDNGELNDLLGNWGFGAGTAIPEPATAALLALAVAAARRPR